MVCGRFLSTVSKRKVRCGGRCGKERTGGSGALAQELDEGLSLREQPPCCLHRDVDLCVRVRVRVVYEDPALAVGCDALGLGNMWSD